MRALELYAGIGGFAAAAPDLEIVAACDVSSHVLGIYAANFEHPTVQLNLEGTKPQRLADFGADLWWLSPPCQPYTVRGKRLDIADPRALSFLRILDAISEVKPANIALENVGGFLTSRGHRRLIQTLKNAGYAYKERIICPTELGVPNRRPRYYLVASLEREPSDFTLTPTGAPFPTYLDTDFDERLLVPPAILEKYKRAFLIHDFDDETVETGTFTSAYGKSWVFSGSYLRMSDERVRLFSDREVLRFLHFPESFKFPDDVGFRKRWKFAGNSLSIATVQVVLRALGVDV